MRALSAPELLEVWERGLVQPPYERAVTLLAACSETPTEVLAGLSVGERNTRLLALREYTMGSQLDSLATCPNCGECVELSLSVKDLSAPSAAAHAKKELSLKAAEYEVAFRLPNSHDLAAVTAAQDVATARQWLLERCLVTVLCDGKEQSPAELPDLIVEAIEKQMEQADPQADLQIALSCPQCTHEWDMAFDIESFFWSEIHAWADRTFREVHKLASRYGWREADILAMSSGRRQVYLEMVGE